MGTGAKLAAGGTLTALGGGVGWWAAGKVGGASINPRLRGAVTALGALAGGTLAYLALREKPVLPGGVCLALYPGDAASTALSRGTPELIAFARPQIVMAHAAPGGLLHGAKPTFERVRALSPKTRAWFGCGVDGLTNAMAGGGSGVERWVTAQLAELAQLAVSLNVEAVVWDQEAAAKAHPEAGRAFAALAQDVFADHAPTVTQGHTAYDQPGQHATYDWASWLGVQAPNIKFDQPEVYVAPDEGGLAPKGALQRRFTRYRASWAAAVRAGWIRPGIPQWPYVQAHGVPTLDTITACAPEHIVSFWHQPPSGMDAQGAVALAALCELRRLGFEGPQALARFHASRAMPPSDEATPATLDALELRAGVR